MRNLDLDDAVHALDFPYSVPSPETRAAIRAELPCKGPAGSLRPACRTTRPRGCCRVAPRSLDALIIAALSATEEAWVVVDRVLEFVAEQPGDGLPVVAAYFTPTERRTADGMHVGWSPFVAALESTEDVPDLRHTRTTVRAVPVGEAALAEEVFADPELRDALNRLAALDPPEHEDILRVHLPTRQVTRVKR